MLLIEGVRCTGCVWLIERALLGVPGVIDAGSTRRHVARGWSGEPARPRCSCSRFCRAPGIVRDRSIVRRSTTRGAAKRGTLKRLLVAGFGAMQSMMFAAVLYLGAIEPLDEATRGVFRWLGFLIATPVVFYSAQPFFAGAALLAAGRLGMDVPVAIAIAAIYAASLIEACAAAVTCTSTRCRCSCSSCWPAAISK